MLTPIKKKMIVELIENFVGETLENFGYDMNRHISYIEVNNEW